jgi:holo-[acyl-carrier protein] synthase
MSAVSTPADVVHLAESVSGEVVGAMAPVGPGRGDDRLRVGVDVVGVDEVADAIRTFGDRYLRRVFTAHELACCARDGDAAGHPGGLPPEAAHAPESLAARFAAKEAVVKVLRPIGARPHWRSIEIVRHPSGWCGLKLTGLAADQSERARITQWAVSLTHDAGIGMAVVVARTGPSDDQAMSGALATGHPTSPTHPRNH